MDKCKELLQTPAKQRIALGIEPKLTSQRGDTEKALMRKRSRQFRNLARELLRKEATEQIRKLKGEGCSIARVSAQMICPKLGKGKRAKKALRH